MFPTLRSSCAYVNPTTLGLRSSSRIVALKHRKRGAKVAVALKQANEAPYKLFSGANGSTL